MGQHTVLALALVHHLAIANNVPLARVCEFFAGIARTLIVEFIPKSDSQVRRMLASRADIFSDYGVEGFERAFAQRFDIVRRVALPESERILYAMRRRA
jgi:ribosomal protein L11 methylase PrmA